MVNFRGPGVAKPAKNEKPMPDGGDSMTYGVEVASNLTGVGGAVNGATRVGAMAVGEDVPLAVTAVARVRAIAAMASVTVVVIATVVVAAVAVATLLLLGAAVSVVVKVGVMQTAPIASSRAARR